MREILFRGKQKDNKQWVYGSLLIEGDGKMFIYPEGIICPEYPIAPVFKEVIPQTVGQFIGWLDQDDLRIFVGDRIEIDWGGGACTCETISYSQEYCYFMYGNNPICELIDPPRLIKVVDTIYDHPELLKQ